MIKYLVMDVDGTLTDGKIYMGVLGEMLKAFNIKDGYGIHDILPKEQITPIIITGRESEIVQRRAEELEIKNIYQGQHEKLNILLELVNELNTVAYIGDDMNDFLCMKAIKEAGGKTGCPADASESIKKVSDFVSKYNGGNGAVRDFIEYIIDNK